MLSVISNLGLKSKVQTSAGNNTFLCRCSKILITEIIFLTRYEIRFTTMAVRAIRILAIRSKIITSLRHARIHTYKGFPIHYKDLFACAHWNISISHHGKICIDGWFHNGDMQSKDILGCTSGFRVSNLSLQISHIHYSFPFFHHIFLHYWTYFTFSFRSVSFCFKIDRVKPASQNGEFTCEPVV